MIERSLIFKKVKVSNESKTMIYGLRKELTVF